MTDVINAAYWSGFEPSRDGLTASELYEEAEAFLMNSIRF